MKPEVRCSLRNSWSAWVLVSESKYMWPCGGITPGSNNLEIVWTVRREGACLNPAKDISKVSVHLRNRELISPFGCGLC